MGSLPLLQAAESTEPPSQRIGVYKRRDCEGDSAFGVVALFAVMLPRRSRLQLSGITVESITNLVSGLGMRSAFEVYGSASSVPSRGVEDCRVIVPRTS
jgi:hypothetical protein